VRVGKDHAEKGALAAAMPAALAAMIARRVSIEETKSFEDFGRQKTNGELKPVCQA
jgi:hypothetical protein